MIIAELNPVFIICRLPKDKDIICNNPKFSIKNPLPDNSGDGNNTPNDDTLITPLVHHRGASGVQGLENLGSIEIEPYKGSKGYTGDYDSGVYGKTSVGSGRFYSKRVAWGVRIDKAITGDDYTVFALATYINIGSKYKFSAKLVSRIQGVDLEVKSLEEGVVLSVDTTLANTSDTYSGFSIAAEMGGKVFMLKEMRVYQGHLKQQDKNDIIEEMNNYWGLQNG